MKIRLKTILGTEFPLEVQTETLVESVRHDIAALLTVSTELPVSSDRVRLIFSGHVLNDIETIGKYEITEGSVVHAVVRPLNAVPSPAPAVTGVPASASVTHPDPEVPLRPPFFGFGGSGPQSSVEYDFESEMGRMIMGSMSMSMGIDGEGGPGSDMYSNVFSRDPSRPRHHDPRTDPRPFVAAAGPPPVARMTVLKAREPFGNAIEAGLSSVRCVTVANPDIAYEDIDPRLDDPSEALAQLLSELGTCMRGLQAPVLRMSGDMQTGAFTNCTTSSQRVQRMNELTNMKNALASLMTAAQHTNRALTQLTLEVVPGTQPPLRTARPYAAAAAATAAARSRALANGTGTGTGTGTATASRPAATASSGAAISSASTAATAPKAVKSTKLATGFLNRPQKGQSTAPAAAVKPAVKNPVVLCSCTCPDCGRVHSDSDSDSDMPELISSSDSDGDWARKKKSFPPPPAPIPINTVKVSRVIAEAAKVAAASKVAPVVSVAAAPVSGVSTAAATATATASTKKAASDSATTSTAASGKCKASKPAATATPTAPSSSGPYPENIFKSMIMNPFEHFGIPCPSLYDEDENLIDPTDTDKFEMFQAMQHTPPHERVGKFTRIRVATDRTPDPVQVAADYAKKKEILKKDAAKKPFVSKAPVATNVKTAATGAVKSTVSTVPAAPLVFSAYPAPSGYRCGPPSTVTSTSATAPIVTPTTKNPIGSSTTTSTVAPTTVPIVTTTTAPLITQAFTVTPLSAFMSTPTTVPIVTPFSPFTMTPTTAPIKTPLPPFTMTSTTVPTVTPIITTPTTAPIVTPTVATTTAVDHNSSANTKSIAPATSAGGVKVSTETGAKVKAEAERERAEAAAEVQGHVDAVASVFERAAAVKRSREATSKSPRAVMEEEDEKEEGYEEQEQHEYEEEEDERIGSDVGYAYISLPSDPTDPSSVADTFCISSDQALEFMLNQTSDEETEQSNDQKFEQSSGQSSDKSSVFVAVPAAAVSGWVPKGRNANGNHSHSASQTQKGRKYSALRGIISAPFITSPFTTPTATPTATVMTATAAPTTTTAAPAVVTATTTATTTAAVPAPAVTVVTATTVETAAAVPVVNTSTLPPNNGSSDLSSSPSVPIITDGSEKPDTNDSLKTPSS